MITSFLLAIEVALFYTTGINSEFILIPRVCADSNVCTQTDTKKSAPKPKASTKAVAAMTKEEVGN